jgi:hypothetical protein
MNKFFFLLIFTIPVFCKAQKIVFDQTDPFTNIRTLSSNISNLKTVSLTPILQTVSTVEIKSDSIIDAKISFIMPEIGVVLNQADTTKKFSCLIKLDNDTVIEGNYYAMAVMPIGMKSYRSFTYLLSESNLYDLINHNVTAIKFTAPEGHQALVEVDGNAKDRISKQYKILLDKIKG